MKRLVSIIIVVLSISFAMTACSNNQDEPVPGSYFDEEGGKFLLAIDEDQTFTFIDITMSGDPPTGRFETEDGIDSYW